MKRYLSVLVLAMAVLFTASLALPILAEAKMSFGAKAGSSVSSISVKGGGGSRSSGGGSRGGSFGGSRSSRSSGSSGGSKGGLFGGSKSSSSGSKGGTFGGAKSPSKSSQSTQPKVKANAKMSPTDKAAYLKAKQNGSVFGNRDAAAADFKTKYASSYGSKFASEPTVRPSYVPSTYSSGNVTYNVNYYPQHGGYGYMDALGTFILYDALSDAAMSNRLMAERGYYYGPMPDKDDDDESGAGTVLLVMLGMGVAIGGGYVVYKMATA